MTTTNLSRISYDIDLNDSAQFSREEMRAAGVMSPEEREGRCEYFFGKFCERIRRKFESGNGKHPLYPHYLESCVRYCFAESSEGCIAYALQSIGKSSEVKQK